MGVVEFGSVSNASWVAVPNFTWPEF
ncbi:hypothetical protein ACOBV8_20090 (plasmid) [Pseudoalteromonas espejiana]